MAPEERILVVDDEQNILDGLMRTVGRSFNLVLAQSGPAALDAMRTQGPFAVVLTDMQMPDMSGLAFLREARKISSQSVFMMLTGNSDQKTAVDAVNQGRVFRFLSKPCPREQLEETLKAAIEQFRLQRAERLLLEKTLAGSIQALLQVLLLTRPKLFQRSARVSKLASWLGHAANDPQPWQVQMAAALSTIGCVALQDELVDSALTGGQLSAEERAQFERHAEFGADVLGAIPRLERTAAIVRGQFNKDAQTADAGGNDDPVAFGIHILRVAQALDEQLCHRKPWPVAVREVLAEPWVHARLREILAGAPPEWISQTQAGQIRTIRTVDIHKGMVLQQDITTEKGELLIATGHEITDMLAERLRNFARRGRIAETTVVLDPLH
jgi:response regulator RpfG family c-di-GMP phosphodiesterase